MKLLKNPVQINISISKPAAGIKQGAYSVYDTQKLHLLKHIFEGRNLKSAILFAGTKQKVKEVERELRKMGLNVGAIHSDLEQAQREEVLLGFRNKNVTILVATDVVSRGIDVQGIELVVNYDVPSDPEDYVHRIGRTARAETKGEAVTLISPLDQRKFSRIEEMIETVIEKYTLPDNFESGPVYDPAKNNEDVRGKSRKSKGKKQTSPVNKSTLPINKPKSSNENRIEGPKVDTPSVMKNPIVKRSDWKKPE